MDSTPGHRSTGALVGTPGSTSRWLRRLLVVALIAACGLAIVRGAWPALGHGNDFAMMYTAARSWLLGVDPYDLATQLDVFEGASGERRERLAPSLNPPVTFPVLAPLAALPWAPARAAMLGLNVALAGVVLFALLRLARLESTSTAGLLFLAMAIAFAPLHTSLRLGQTSIAAMACIMGSIALLGRSRPVSAGGLLAVAMALKPQIAVIFIVFHACRGRWRLVAGTAGGLAVLGVIGVGWLTVRQVDWLPSLVANARATFIEGGVGTPTAENPLRFQLINPPYPLGLFIVSPVAVRAIVFAAVAVMLAVAVRRDRRSDADQTPLDVYAIVAVLALMVTYHRAYDAVLLYLPLLTAIVAARDGCRGRSLLAFLLVGFFLLPLSSIFHQLAAHGDLPATITNGWWWEAIVMPAQAWALIALAVTICLPARVRAEAADAPGASLYCSP